MISRWASNRYLLGAVAGVALVGFTGSAQASGRSQSKTAEDSVQVRHGLTGRGAVPLMDPRAQLRARIHNRLENRINSRINRRLDHKAKASKPYRHARQRAFETHKSNSN